MNETTKLLKPYFFAFLGVLIFSGTLPSTKIALQEVAPLFVFSARTAIASCLAVLWAFQNKSVFSKAKTIRKEIFLSMLGTVIGFPLLTSFALLQTGASHGALVITLVPILTAMISSWVFKTKRTALFWFFAAAGTIIVFATVIFENQIVWKFSDSLLFLSSLVVSVGYVYGIKATKVIGGIGTISLSLIVSLPLVLPILFYSMPTSMINLKTLLSLLYLGMFSMFFGFVFWYRGLAEGEADRVSLIQLLQLFLTYFFSILLLNETISLAMVLSAGIVVACLAGTKLTR